jgi:hypothetical protein
MREFHAALLRCHRRCWRIARPRRAARAGIMQSVADTSKTGDKYRYYGGVEQRRKKCALELIPKEDIEQQVVGVVAGFLDVAEKLGCLAADLVSRPVFRSGRYASQFVVLCGCRFKHSRPVIGIPVMNACGRGCIGVSNRR